MANVRFYRLETLPSFEVPKHQGIFVHVTSKLIRTGIEGKYNYSWGEKLSSTEIQNIVINIGERPVLVPDWMDLRRLDIVESGLWFGGENGWELLSNETNSAAINAAIDDKINALNAGGFTQATIGANTTEGSESATGSTLTIKGIKETKGKIEQDNANDVNIAIDGVYNESTNKIATQSTVTNVINGLNAGTIQAVTFNTSSVNGNTTLTFNGVKEENGLIAQGNGTGTFIVGDAKLNIKIGSTTIENVFSANAQSDGDIKLNENVFKKDENNVISVITKNNDVSSTNPLVTQNDINGLATAMHYRGGVTSVPTADNSTKKGDVWIVTTPFDGYEAGDMFIARGDGANATFDTVQGNLTLGTGDGQIAKNVGALADGYLVVGVNSETGKGIKTVEFDVTNLTGTTGKNERNLTLDSKLADRELQSGGVEGLYHSVGITDTFTIMGRDMSKSFSISSRNRSISIEKVGAENSTDAQIDLIWNTVMDA